MIPLRQRLRSETRPEHERLDAAFGALDLSVRADYVTFLKAHYAAHRLIEPLIQPAPARLAALATDLQTLGETRPRGFEMAGLAKARPLGLSYVVAGSHLGGKLLKRAWEDGNDKETLAAGQYFALQGLSEHWQKTLKDLSAVAPSEENNIVDAAKCGFDCFFQALRFVS